MFRLPAAAFSVFAGCEDFLNRLPTTRPALWNPGVRQGRPPGSRAPGGCWSRVVDQRGAPMAHHGHVPGGHAIRRRDRGRRRVQLTTVAIATAAAAGSIVLSTGYARTLPGKSSPPAPAPTITPGPSHHPATAAAPSSTKPAPSHHPAAAAAPGSAKPAPSRRAASRIPASRNTPAAAAQPRSAAPSLTPPSQPPTAVAQPTQAPPTKSGGS